MTVLFRPHLGNFQNIFQIFSKPFFQIFALKINEYIFPVFKKSRVFARNGSRTKMARSYHRQISWNCVPRLFRYIKNRKIKILKIDASCIMHHASCIMMHHASCIMHHASCIMMHHASSCIMHHASCIMHQDASCTMMHHASCIMNYSWFIIIDLWSLFDHFLVDFRST